MRKKDDFDRMLERHLQDPEFRREWEATRPEYEALLAKLKAEIATTPAPAPERTTTATQRVAA
jgi:hypothetical protein